MSRYDDIAAAAGFHICGEKDPHEHVGGTWVHFTHERFTEAGAFALLEIMHGLQDERPRGMEEWRWRHRRGLWMLDVALRAKVKLPKPLWAPEKARTREALAEYVGRVPMYARPQDYEKARRWSARS